MAVRGWLLALVLLSMEGRLPASPDIVPLGPFGGDVRSLAVHPREPERVFLGTATGQIYLSADAGKSWHRLVPGLGRREIVVENLIFDPSDPNVLYAGTWELKSDKGWLYRTRDAGKTWELMSLQPYKSAIRAVAVAPSDPKTLAVGISEGVLLSRDGGHNWTRITRGYRSLHNVNSLAFDPGDSEVLYVGTFRLGWKTIDQGKKWEAIHQGMHWDSDMFSLLVDPSSPDVLYASACTGIYKSQSAGQAWTRVKEGIPDEARRTRTLHLDPTNPTTIYAGTVDGLFVSHNGGGTWQSLIAGVVVNTISVHPHNSRIIMVGTDDAGVLRSEDGGSSFSPSNYGFVHRNISALAVDGGRSGWIYAGVGFDQHHGGFFVSRDGGMNWETFNGGLEQAVSSITAILPAMNGKVYVSSSQGVFVGEPLASDWQRFKGTEGLRVLDMAFADQKQQAVVLASPAGLHRLELPSGRLEKGKLAVPPGEISSVYRDAKSGFLFAGSAIGVFRSDDEGRNWTMKVTGLPPIPITALEGTDGRLICATQSGLYWSSDLGDSWHQSQGIHRIEISTVKAARENPQLVYAADLVVGFLYRSLDGGAAWELLNVEAPSTRFARLDFSAAGELLAGTLSDGVCRIVDQVEKAE